MLGSKSISILNTAINDLVQNIEPSGSVLVSMNNEPIYQNSFGYADRINKIPMSINTQMLIGSVTKQFTAIAVLKALFDKKTDIQDALNQTVAFYLPERHEIWSGDMPVWANRVTVHQLLCHSSGIPNYTSLPNFEKQKLPKTADIVTFFKKRELEFSPGSRFSYCNSGYILLGAIVREISGQDFDIYLKNTFFDPLEMRSTFFPTQGTVDILIKSDPRFVNLARGYQFEIASTDPGLEEIDNYVEMQIPGAGGSLISTASDLLRWNTALYSFQILPGAVLELMLHPHITIENGNDHYGYGIEVISSAPLGTYYSHRGGIPGFHSTLTFIPKLKMSIVILENIVEDRNHLKQEIEEINARLANDLPNDEKMKEIDRILERKYPHIINNKKRYQLAPVYDAIIKILGDFIPYCETAK